MNDINEFLQNTAKNSIGYNISFQNAGEAASEKHGVSNASYFGNPGSNKFEADQLQDKIEEAEDYVRHSEQTMRRPGDQYLDRIKQQINKALALAIDKNKDKYADAKKELRDYGVEAISDCAQFDDYYDEKYGGAK